MSPLDEKTMATISEAIDKHISPVRCKQCGGTVEAERRHYATPVCFACLPPPMPLPVKR